MTKASVFRYGDVSLKKTMHGFGHDMGGMSAQVYLKDKHLGGFFDDGWGGEPELHIEDENIKRLTEYLNTTLVRKQMFDDGWDFLPLAEISLGDIISFLSDRAVLESAAEKRSKTRLVFLTNTGVATLEPFTVPLSKLLKSASTSERVKTSLITALREFFDAYAPDPGEVLYNSALVESIGVTVPDHIEKYKPLTPFP